MLILKSCAVFKLIEKSKLQFQVKRLASCVVPTISNAGIAPKTYSILSGDRIGVVCHSGYLGTFYHSPYQIENYIYCNNGRSESRLEIPNFPYHSIGSMLNERFFVQY